MTVEDFLGRQPLHIAAQAGATDTVALLLVKLGANPNQCAGSSLTPLHYAAKVWYGM